jgi:hypothetical protein
MISFQTEPAPALSRVVKVSSPRIVPANPAGFREAPSEEGRSDVGPKQAAEVVETIEAKPKPLSPIEKLSMEIQTSYPTSQLRMSEVKGKMLVRGTCATPEDASEIIRLVRSQFLVPVDDQLVIR